MKSARDQDRERIQAYRVLRRVAGEMADGYVVHPTTEKRAALALAIAALLEGISEHDRLRYKLDE